MNIKPLSGYILATQGVFTFALILFSLNPTISSAVISDGANAIDALIQIDFETPAPIIAEQVSNTIFISKAFKLDVNRNVIEDIYNIVKAQDNIWSTVETNQYIRVTFAGTLTNGNDITLYAKPTTPGQAVRVEVYKENGTELITSFSSIDQENTYKVYLTNLQTPTDVF